jgi:uridine kinase
MPEIIALADAAEAIRRRALALATPRAIIAITGPVGAGKSTLARALGATILATDDYLPDYAAVAPLERDDPRHADLARLARDLASLRAGSETLVPSWCFHAHRRVGEKRIAPADLIIVEGIHALHPPAGDAADLRVFVDAPPSVRWSRWEALETRGERGMGVARAREHFESVAEPTFQRFAPGYRAAAHLIVVNA